MEIWEVIHMLKINFVKKQLEIIDDFSDNGLKLLNNYRRWLRKL